MNSINVFFYNKSPQWGFVLAMLMWFLGIRDTFIKSPVYGIPTLVFLGFILALVVDETVYYYEGQMERKLRKILDDEGLILPRNFVSERLAFRELLPGDWKLIQALSKDWSITQYVDDIDENMSRAQSRRWIIDHMNMERTALRCSRILIEKETGQTVGGIVIINGHEVEYWLKTSYRGKGLAYEAVLRALEVIDQDKNLILFAKTYSDNTQSNKLLAKLGFAREDQVGSDYTAGDKDDSDNDTTEQGTSEHARFNNKKTKLNWIYRSSQKG